MGAYLALGNFPVLSRPVLREITALFGIGFITWAVFKFSKETPFPGFHALLPCMGAMLIIYSGKHGPSLVAKILSFKPFVFLGLLSYSLYLWHWPLLVFYKQFRIDVSQHEIALVLSIALVASIFSWRFIEKPFRGTQGVLKKHGIFFGAGLLMILAIGFGLWGHFSEGWPQRLPSQAVEIANVVNSKNPRQADCFSSDSKWISIKDACIYGANIAPSFAVWGDSHADSLIAMIGGMLGEQHKSARYYAYPGCPPLVGLRRVNSPKNKCLEFNKEVLEAIEHTSEINTVILVARFSAYIYGYSFDFGPAEKADEQQPFITDESGLSASVDDRKAYVTESFFVTVERIS